MAAVTEEEEQLKLTVIHCLTCRRGETENLSELKYLKTNCGHTRTHALKKKHEMRVRTAFDSV